MILITGMHRSGTSLVAMTMEALGVDLGDHRAFYEADQWNAKGYFERRDVMDINSRLITGLPRTASKMEALAGQAIYLAEPRWETISARGSKLAGRILEVGAEIRDGAVKDPRFCLTWPVWGDHVEIEACVVCVRHPFEVADSLRRRQSIPLKLGLRFWRYHIRALQERTPPRLVVVELASLIRKPEAELGMLANALQLEVDSQEAARLFQDKYSPGLAKTTAPTDRPSIDPETTDLWEWILQTRPIPTFESQ